jgi:hypothetical protein
MPDDSVQVKGPDGKNYAFPKGTTKEVAIGYFKKKGIGTTPAAKSTYNTGDVYKDIGAGFVKGAGETVNTISKLINKIPGVGETLAPSQGVKAVEKMTPSTNPAQSVGKGGEAIAEFLTGEEALKGLSTALKLKDVATIAAITEKFPKLGAIAEAGMKAMGLGTAQSALHGEDHPLKSGAWTAAAGVAGEVASQGLKAVPTKATNAAWDAVNRWLGLKSSDLLKGDRDNIDVARKIGQTVYEKAGIKATLEGQKQAIEDARQMIQNQTDKLINNTKGRLVPFHADLEAVNSHVADNLEKAGKLTDPVLKGLNSNYMQFRGNQNPNITVKEALELRKIIGKEINWNNAGDANRDVRQEFLEELYHKLNDGIERALGPTDARKFAAFNKDQQRLIQARTAIGKKELQDSFKDIGKWGPGMLGRSAAGAFLGGEVGSHEGKEGENTLTGALAGAAVGALAGPKTQTAFARGAAIAAPKLAAAAAKGSAPAARALQSIARVSGGGSGGVGVQ